MKAVHASTGMKRCYAMGSGRFGGSVLGGVGGVLLRISVGAVGSGLGCGG
jgi:hypothetical protein